MVGIFKSMRNQLIIMRPLERGKGGQGFLCGTKLAPCFRIFRNKLIYLYIFYLHSNNIMHISIARICITWSKIYRYRVYTWNHVSFTFVILCFGGCFEKNVKTNPSPRKLSYSIFICLIFSRKCEMCD